MLCAAGVWTHFVTAFVPIGHAVWLGWRATRHHEIRRAVHGGVALALAAVATIALYAPALHDLLDTRGMYVASRGDEPSVFGTEGWHALLQLGGSWYAWAALPGLALLVFGGVTTMRSTGRSPNLRDAAAITLLGLPVLLLVVLASGSWMYARFALFSLPGAVLLMAVGIDRMWTRHRVAAVCQVARVVERQAWRNRVLLGRRHDKFSGNRNGRGTECRCTVLWKRGGHRPGSRDKGSDTGSLCGG